MQLLSKIPGNQTVGFLEARRKAVLRGKGNSWAPVSWSFDKIREVGVLYYLKLHFV